MMRVGFTDPASWAPDELRALEAMANAWNLQLVPAEGSAAVDGLVCRSRSEAVATPVPRLCFLPPAQPAPPGSGESVRFTAHPWLPEVLRGQSVSGPGTGSAPSSQTAGRAPVLWSGPVARWEWDPGAAGSLQVRQSPPRLGAGETLAEIFNGEHLLPALPLWLFFRHLTRSRLAPEVRWEDPPLRACLLVDDPNLRSTRYGHIDYQVLARQAREWRFHVAMATIPLDQWSVSPRARQLFATHREHLSLVIHGHTHARAELARCATPEACRQLVAGAIRRILAAEQRFDLAIDRVMVPPHGEVNEAMLAALARGEVEAVATNRWSLWRHIAPAALGPAAEWAPAIWRGGLPIVHRYRFASPIAKQEALFAALTGRPILPYGHHQDFRDAAVVRRAVAEVNALGAVDWGPMRAVLERNYRHRNSGGRLVVRPYSRRVVVALPPDVDELQVDGPGGRVAIRWVGGETAARPLGPGAWLRPAGAREVEIRCGGAPAMATADEAAERIPVALRLRRLAAELRDRCLLGGAALGPAAEDFGQAVRLALAFS